MFIVSDGLTGSGDAVRIQECRPMSKLKRWEVLYEAAAAKH